MRVFERKPVRRTTSPAFATTRDVIPCFTITLPKGFTHGNETPRSASRFAYSEPLAPFNSRQKTRMKGFYVAMQNVKGTVRARAHQPGAFLIVLRTKSFKLKSSKNCLFVPVHCYLARVWAYRFSFRHQCI